MKEMRSIYRILVGKPKGETLLPEPGVDVRIILK
jgi:hypothetical protein